MPAASARFAHMKLYLREETTERLLASLFDLLNDGLEPNDYHVEALQSYRSELRRAKELPVAEQAGLEVLATDALLLGLSHLYLGKVDPADITRSRVQGTLRAASAPGLTAARACFMDRRISGFVMLQSYGTGGCRCCMTCWACRETRSSWFSRWSRRAAPWPAGSSRWAR